MFLLLAACSDYVVAEIETTPEALPVLSISPKNVQFGVSQPLDDQVAKIEVSNIGEALLTTEPRLETTSVTVLSWTTEIEPGETVEAELVWDASETLESTLWVDSNDKTLGVEMFGEIAAGGLLVTPDPVDFGWVEAGDTAWEQATILNSGEATVELTSLLVEGERFAVVDPGVPLSLGGGESLVVDLSFNPLDSEPHGGMLWVGADVGQASAGLVGNAEEENTEENDDPCHQPDFGYEEHPEALLYIEEWGEVSATFQGSEAGYTNELWLGTEQLFVGHSSSVGDSVVLDAAVGEELRFKLVVQDTGDTFWIGPASRNADGQRHAAVTFLGDCTYQVGFEDTWGGGDQDFDDIVMSVSGPLSMEW